MKTLAIRTVLIMYIILLVGVVWLIPTANFGYLPINLIPFKTIGNYVMSLMNGTIPVFVIVKNLAGNVLLLFPLGFLLPLQFSKLSIKKIIMLGVMIPIVIEGGQFILYLLKLGTRSIDIDDVILNFIGYILGYFLVNIFKIKLLSSV
ncbi:VanZ family protein [Heyndrickxia faecalis]|uniref:VanZ family protein n=1 Tax=Heyndrickxia TaxID=2837504 RepID=UPI002E1E5355|nr:VanZ family protein [Weizmannia sp. CD-2023]MED4866572.1 VanZ family protein [Weizmannia sp. CD-2023]MED4900723.1 VanZ family protein [Weizmannia sp. CD-2023]